MRKHLSVVFYILLLSTAIGEKNALSENIAYSPYDLGEVVVSARRNTSEKIGTTTRVTAAEIESSGARTLDEVIDLLPGIYVRMGGSGTPRVDVRGFRTRHVILLLDGIPFGSTYDGQFDPTIIPVENIAEIKVITGGASLLYGPGGNGGVINIISKKGRKGIQGSLSGEAGSENARIGRFTASGATDRFDVFVSGSANKRDGFPVSGFFEDTGEEDGGRRENSDFERQNLDADMSLLLGESTSVGLRANYMQGENGVPWVVNFDRDDPFTKSPKFERVDDLEGNALQLAYSHAPAGLFSTRGWVYMNRQDMVENRYDDSGLFTQAQRGAYSSDSTSEIYGANLQGEMDLSALGNATLAVILENHRWDADGFEMTRSGRSDFEKQEDYQVYTGALEYGISPIEKMDLIISYAFHQMNKEEGDENGGSWLAGVSYEAFDRTRLLANYARKLRYPSIKDLYDVSSGNPDLEAERTVHYEIGVVRELFTRSEASLILYRIDAEDFIEKDGSGISRNFEDNRFKGVEVAFVTRPADELMVRASYSYLDATDEAADAEREELQHRPKHKYTLEATRRFDTGLMLHGDVVRVTDQYFYDSDDSPPLLKKALDDYTLLNVKISQRFLENTLEAYAGVDNIADENYEQSYGLPQSGRFYYGGMRYRF